MRDKIYAKQTTKQYTQKQQGMKGMGMTGASTNSNQGIEHRYSVSCEERLVEIFILIELCLLSIGGGEVSPNH